MARAAQLLADFKGDHLSVKMFDGVPDTSVLTVSATSGSATITLTSGSFGPQDAGKRIIIYGAKSSGRESLIAEAVAGAATATAYAVTTSIDAQAATKVKFGFNCVTNDATWEVFGSNASNFAGEVSVYGPQSVIAKDPSDLFIDTTPNYRYYRVKAKSSVAGFDATGYTTMTALGYVLGAQVVSVTSLTQAVISVSATVTRASCIAVMGTPNTVSIQDAIDYGASLVAAGTADGGITVLLPPGNYLIDAPINQKPCVTVKGHHGGSSIVYVDGEAFPVDTVVWNMTGTFAADAQIAFFTRLEDMRIDCMHVPGSIGVFCDALQENSGLYRTTVIKWGATGIRACTDTDRYGCTNWMVQDVWVYPSNLAFAADAVRGLEINYALDTVLIRSTILGQAGYLCGYGKAVDVQNGNLRAYKLHTESARIGCHFNVGSGGLIDGFSGQSFVEQGISIASGATVEVRSAVATGQVSLVDERTGAEYTDYFISSYIATSLPVRFAGGGSGPDIQQWIAGVNQFGAPAMRMSSRGSFLTDGGDRRYPNIPALIPLNFGAPTQGGWLAINAESNGYPNWIPTSGWTFTVVTATDTLTLTNEEGAAGHTFANDDTVEVGTLGTLPAGLVTATTYYVINANTSAGTLKLSATLGGAAIDITTTGSGTLYIASSLKASWLRLGASRFEYRTGRVPNTQGTDPGTLIFRSDSVQGNFNPLLYFDTEFGIGPMKFGNEIAANRFRWRHGQAGQKILSLEQSADSGATWTDVLLVDCSTGTSRFSEPLGINTDPSTGNYLDVDGNVRFRLALRLNAMTADRPLKVDSNKDVFSGKIDLGDTKDVTGTGLSSSAVTYWTGSVLATQSGSNSSFDAVNTVGTTSITFVISIDFAMSSYSTQTITVVTSVSVTTRSVVKGLVQ